MFCKHGVKCLYRLDRNFSWQSKLDIKQDYAFKDKDGTVRLILEQGGKITVTSSYAWRNLAKSYSVLDFHHNKKSSTVQDDEG